MIFDTLVDSSRYFRYLDLHDFSDAALMKHGCYSWVAASTTMHLLGARFLPKCCDHSCMDEPLMGASRGLILGPDGQKMSKSKGNVINPDEFVQKYGADAVRIYLAFIGPYNEPGSYPWNLDGVASMRKFLERITRLVEKHAVVSPVHTVPERMQQMIARASVKVAQDGDRFKFNTSVSALMILVNELEVSTTVPKTVLQYLVIMLAPFVPHLAEHLWEKLGGEGSVHKQSWPAEYVVTAAQEVEVVVQVNGKRRGVITLATNISEADATTAARTLPTVSVALGGKEPNRVVYVAGKILNLVV